MTNDDRTGTFWDRHNKLMQDPEHEARFNTEIARIRAVDAQANANDDLRTALTKLADEIESREHPDIVYAVVDRFVALLAAHPAPAPVSEVALKVDDAKMLRETLAVAQTATSGFAYTRIDEHVDRIQGLIDQLDGHRPLGPDGKHGDLHTATCGCDDAPVSDTRREDVARALSRERLDELGATERTPTTEYVRDFYAKFQANLDLHPGYDDEKYDQAEAEFDRFLAVYEAEVRERIAQDIVRAVGEGTASDIARGATR